MRMAAIALTGLLLSAVCAPAVRAADPETADNRADGSGTTYESPVLSLLLLPVNLLIKMASLLGSGEPAKQAAPPSAPPPADGAK